MHFPQNHGWLQVLAMARPWQENLVAHKLPQALQAAGIGMILNLQVKSTARERYMHRPSSRVAADKQPSAADNCVCALLAKLTWISCNCVSEFGEHAHCGRGILPASGFSYDPEAFMAADVGVYNFSWRDMGVPTLFKMMDIVQVKLSYCLA